MNGDLNINCIVKTDDIDNPCESGEQLTVVLSSPVRGWKVSVNWGDKSPADYGGVVSQDTILSSTDFGPLDIAGDGNIMATMSAYVTGDGEIDTGGRLSVRITWDSDDQRKNSDVLWDRGDRIDFDIVATRDSFSGDIFSLYTIEVDK